MVEDRRGSRGKTPVRARWRLEALHGNARSLLVVCPRCGELGRLHWSRRIGWYVKHGSSRSHGVCGAGALEVPLHEPRINLVRYVGGDTFLLPYLARMVPAHHAYVEVFGGSASLLLNKPPSRVEVYNDLDGNLVNLFRVVRDRYAEFVERLRWLLASRRQYYEFLKALRTGGIDDPVERAVAYWYVMMLGYAGKFGGGLGFGPRRNMARDLWAALERLALIHRRLRNVVIEQLDFREVLKRYDTERTFFYLDPPHLYLSTEADRGRDYYAVGFTDKDYMDLLAHLERLKGKWLLKQATEVPWLLDWARRRGYHVERLVLKKSARPNPRAGKLDAYFVYLIANYRLRARRRKKG